MRDWACLQSSWIDLRTSLAIRGMYKLFKYIQDDLDARRNRVNEELLLNIYLSYYLLLDNSGQNKVEENYESAKRLTSYKLFFHVCIVYDLIMKLFLKFTLEVGVFYITGWEYWIPYFLHKI